MPATRSRRRKEDRPAEITRAAMEAFAENGYDATRVDDVARRAGVSKGLLYLYFETKEELFRAVIRSFVEPHISRLAEAVSTTELGAEAFLRGPFLDLARDIPRSPLRHVVRLMIAEGPKHPDLTRYYWRHVAGPGLAALRRLLASGVETGELRRSALNDFPQLLVTPVLFATLWGILFEAHEHLDVDGLLEAHVDFVVAALRNESPAS